MATQMRLNEQISGSVPVVERVNEELVTQTPWVWVINDPDGSFHVLLSGELSENIQITNTGRAGVLSLAANAQLINEEHEPLRSLMLADIVTATAAEIEHMDVEWTEPGPPQQPAPPDENQPDRPDPT